MAEFKEAFSLFDQDGALAEHAYQIVEGSQQKVLTDLMFIPAVSSRHGQEDLWLESACRYQLFVCSLIGSIIDGFTAAFAGNALMHSCMPSMATGPYTFASLLVVTLIWVTTLGISQIVFNGKMLFLMRLAGPFPVACASFLVRRPASCNSVG
ncbi:unnamed protein product [Prorocentrum cordatum]|uniref:Uncharacterized protein n=1 Tax=Prorocentrum cordatum TaxID=2364126 RepID=A0ABN9UF25_9DINO|nr:unnamed protein product [Polarella glacialis]